MTTEPVFGALLDLALRKALVVKCAAHESMRVLFDDGVPEEIECDVLVTSGSPPQFVTGDVVLVWRPTPGERGVVLGLLRSARPAEPSTKPDEVLDELTIEARRSLTLRVGEGSITIREDGKILIKGKDLVSHAKRLNRIKGGAVQIN